MLHEITINNFRVSFDDAGHPLWTSIDYEGKEIARFHHRELIDLEYALTRIRARIAAVLPADIKHEITG